MPRQARTATSCESNIYHITARGAGRRDIFESDSDRERFLDMLSKETTKRHFTVLAWCLMENHVHLLVRGELPLISTLMHALLGGYASYFNTRHGHVGHVFQGRFGSKPVASYAQLLETIRYIHQNPLRAGIASSCHYGWSSYDECLEGHGIAEVSEVLPLFDDMSSFIAFHQQLTAQDTDSMEHETGTTTRRMCDEDALTAALSALNSTSLDSLLELSKTERDAALARLRSVGLSIRQIERLTGIGRGIIARAKA